MIPLSQYRALFPHIKKGTIYMNHSAVSPFSSRVAHALRAYVRSRSEEEIENYFSFQKTIVETRTQIAQLINAPTDRIAFVQNTSSGLSLLASGLPWNPGDRIVLNNMEFPANVYPFLNCRRSGVEIDFVAHHQGQILIEDIEAALTPRTRLLSISHVQFLSGYRSDLEALGTLCRERGIIFCVDPIQSLGATSLDVQRDQIDFVACGGHKWLMAPQGIGFIYLSAELQEQIEPAYVGWASVKDAWNLLDYQLELLESASRFETGTMNFLGICGLNAALGLLLEAGLDRIEAHILDLSRHVSERLLEMGQEVITPLDPAKRLGIVTFRHPRSKDIFAGLAAQKIEIAEREGCLRFSPHFYNSHEEMEIALKALGRVIRSNRLLAGPAPG